MAEKYECGCCSTITDTENILKAPNPFLLTADEIWGCPHCFAVEDFQRVCDADNCISISVSGMTVGDEYKFLCKAHSGA